jgi:hypothetical protein
MMRLKRSLLLVLGAAWLTYGCYPINPLGPRHVFVVDVSPDGRHLAAINRAGQIRVWDLTKKVLVASLQKISNLDLKGRGYTAVALRGTRGEVLFDCEPSKLCAHDLSTGQDRVLFEIGDIEDSVHLVVASADGNRVAAGTLLGRVLTFDAEKGELRTRKPKDIWSEPAFAMYLVEGTRSLDRFVTSTSDATAAPRAEREGWYVKHREEGYLEGSTGKRGPMWLGPVVWPLGEKEETTLTVDLGFRVRGDFSLRGDSLALCDEGGPQLILKVPGYEAISDVRLLEGRDVPGCFGIRFLDASGDYLGITGQGEPRIGLFSRAPTGHAWVNLGTRGLRRIPGTGARPITSLPERNWLFVGLMEGGVDWYEFQPGPDASLRFISHLDWD